MSAPTIETSATPNAAPAQRHESRLDAFLAQIASDARAADSLITISGDCDEGYTRDFFDAVRALVLRCGWAADEARRLLPRPAGDTKAAAEWFMDSLYSSACVQDGVSPAPSKPGGA